MNTDQSRLLYQFLIKEFDKKELRGYGLDLLQKGNTNEFYLVDFNFDILTWLRFGNNVSLVSRMK